MLVNPVAAGVVGHPRNWRWSSFADIERRGCSADIAAVTGGTQAFLAYVEDTVERIHALRAGDARSCWRIIGQVLPNGEGRG